MALWLSVCAHASGEPGSVDCAALARTLEGSPARDGHVATAERPEDPLSSEWCAHWFDPAVLDAGALGDADGDGAPSAVGASAPGQSPATASPPAGASAARRAFGTSGSWRWNVLGGWGTDADGTAQVQFGGGVSWFVVDHLSIDVQADVDYFSQDGPEAWGGDVELLLRWHFLARETWSVYIDGGCGLMWTDADVPPDSARFNFTPQAGGGFTLEVGPDVRLMAGARWFHVSSANTGSPNPGLNNVFLYAGLSVGF